MSPDNGGWNGQIQQSWAQDTDVKARQMRSVCKEDCCEMLSPCRALCYAQAPRWCVEHKRGACGGRRYIRSRIDWRFSRSNLPRVEAFGSAATPASSAS